MRVDRVHEILATVDSAERYDLDRMADALANRFRRISQVMFVLLRWDNMYSDLLELAVAARCRCTAYTVVTPGSDRPKGETVRSGSSIVMSVGTPEEILAGRLGPL